ncbi:chromosome partitioning protein ParB, partial [[Clostridium] innocuum]|nr:chromosome partitioning protein ParB [[Clostridium] innocuum]
YSVEKLADEVGESYKQVQRYIRLTYLIEPLRDMVDEIREDGLTMALNPAYEISFLTEQEQWDLEHYIYDYAKTPSLAQAQELKRRSQAKVLDTDFMEEILSMDKPNQKEKISFKMEELDQYFPKSYSQRQRIDIIHRLLENWAKRKEKSQER